MQQRAQEAKIEDRSRVLRPFSEQSKRKLVLFNSTTGITTDDILWNAGLQFTAALQRNSRSGGVHFDIIVISMRICESQNGTGFEVVGANFDDLPLRPTLQFNEHVERTRRYCF